MPTTPAHVDVAIVGGGPVAAMLLVLLDRYGLSAVALEREHDVYHLPRAVGLDGEVARVLQAAGLSGDLPRVLRPSRGMIFQNESGETLLDWSYPEGAIGAEGWADQYTYHQPDLESALRQRITASTRVELRTGTEVTDIAEDESGVEVTLLTAAGGRSSLRADWVIGADGASSTTRDHIGSRYETLGPSQPWIVIDMLVEPTAQTPAKSIQYCWPSRPHMYLRLPGVRRRWEFMLLDGDDPAEITKPDAVWALLGGSLDRAAGQIERATVYRFRSMIADRWRRGRILLAGDAAHLQPPMLAQGLCSGIRDAANLAWKLAAVQRGGVDPALLDDYQSERSPHVRAWIEEATRLASIVQTTDPEAARRRDQELLAGTRSLRSIKPRLGAPVSGWPTDDEVLGTICPQILHADGSRTDDEWGLRFVVLTRPELVVEATRIQPGLVDGAGLLARVQSGLRAGQILDRLGRDLVVVRPDRYIGATARGADEVSAALASIPVHEPLDPAP